MAAESSISTRGFDDGNGRRSFACPFWWIYKARTSINTTSQQEQWYLYLYTGLLGVRTVYVPASRFLQVDSSNLPSHIPLLRSALSLPDAMPPAAFLVTACGDDGLQRSSPRVSSFAWAATKIVGLNIASVQSSQFQIVGDATKPNKQTSTLW